MNRPVALGQTLRIRAEMLHVVGNLLDALPGNHPGRRGLRAEALWWQSEGSSSLRDVVVRSFETRAVCLASSPPVPWRESLSHIGERDAAGAERAYEYERAYPVAPSRRPYETWNADPASTTSSYSSSGMAAITAWLLTLNAAAVDEGETLRLVTNRLYHETTWLFELCRGGRLELFSCADLDHVSEVVVSAAGASSYVFLDSSYPGGSAEDVATLLGQVRPERVRGVAWDNSLVPFTAPPGSEAGGFAPPVPLVVVRSHSKLDQLGLELCPLGSAVTFRPSSGSGLRLGRLSRTMSIIGAFPSSRRLRLLEQAQLPDLALTERANHHLQNANRLGGAILTCLSEAGAVDVEQYHHACFVNVHLLRSRPSLLRDVKVAFVRVESEARRHGLPVWSSASFGFNYTALTVHEEAPLGGADDALPHAVIRVAFGGHDDEVTTAIASLLVDAIRPLRALA